MECSLQRRPHSLSVVKQLMLHQETSELIIFQWTDNIMVAFI